MLFVFKITFLRSNSYRDLSTLGYKCFDSADYNLFLCVEGLTSLKKHLLRPMYAVDDMIAS